MTVIQPPTRHPCPHCHSEDLGVTSTHGWQQCNECKKFHQPPSIDGVMGKYKSGYTPCTKCKKSVYVSQREWNMQSVNCNRCNSSFRIYPGVEISMTFQSNSGGVSGPYSSIPDHHILLRIKATTDRIERFNRLLKKVDSDWPFDSCSSIRVCLKCLGVVWATPRLTPSDVKAAARQVGEMKVKIRHFAPSTSCYGAGMSNLKYISSADAAALFLPGGPATFRTTHIAPTLALPSVIPSTTDDILIGEVLNTSGTTAPSVLALPGLAHPAGDTPEPDIETSDEWGGWVQ